MSASAAGRIGLVSHTLPPTPWGQAVTLRRILGHLDRERLVLISREPPPSGGDQGWRRQLLPRLRQLPVPSTSYLFAGNIATNAAWALYRRTAQIEAIARRERLALLLACSGDLYDLPATFYAARRLGIPFVAYVLDDYRYQWMGAMRAVAALLEPSLLRGAAAVIVPNSYLGRDYRQRYGIECQVMNNPCSVPALDAGATVAKSRIVYTGSIYHAHYDAFRNLLRAIDRLGRPELKLALYSAHTPAELAGHGIAGKAIEHHGSVGPLEAVRAVTTATVAFLPLAFHSPIPEVIRTSAPGKMGDYMAAARPILAHAPPGSFINGFVRERGCGLAVDQCAPEPLAAAIARLIDDEPLCQKLGAAGRQIAEAEFAEERVAERFTQILAGAGLRL